MLSLTFWEMADATNMFRVTFRRGASEQTEKLKGMSPAKMLTAGSSAEDIREDSAPYKTVCTIYYQLKL